MAIRELEVILKANITQFEAKMGAAAARTRAFGAEVAGTLTTTDRKQSAALRNISNVALGTGAALTAAFGFAVKTAADFEKQISAVGAVAGATGGQLGLLRDAALKAGADTAFTASQAAQAEEELVKAGLSVADVLAGGLTGSLALAAAGQLELGRAAEISSVALNIFGLHGDDVGRVADVLAQGANKSATDVEGLGQALGNVGPVAAQVGFSLEDTTTILELFAQHGTEGAEAGTLLRSTLSRLVPVGARARQVAEDLGLSFVKANGEFKDAKDIVGELQRVFGPMSEATRTLAINQIFGQEAQRGVNVLIDEGVAGFQKFRGELDETGVAERVAEERLDNLAGDLEKLRGSIETALIQGGSGATSALRGMTQAATGAVNAFGSLPSGVQGAVTGFVGLTGVSLLAVGGAVRLSQAVGRLSDNFRVMGADGQLAAGKVSRGISGMARAAGTVAVIVGAFVAVKGALDAMGVSVDAQNRKFRDLLDEVNDADLAQGFQKLFAFDEETGLGEFKRLADDSIATAQRLRDAMAEAGEPVEKLDEILRNEAEGQRQANQDAADGQGVVDDLAGKVDDAGGSFQDTTQDVKEFSDSLSELFDTTFGMEEATSNMQEALDQLEESVKKNGQTFDLTTEAGRENAANLRDVGQAAQEAAAEQEKLTGQGPELNFVLATERQAFIDAAIAAGKTEEQAKQLADQLGLIPKDVSIAFHTTGTSESLQAIGLVAQKVNELRTSLGYAPLDAGTSLVIAGRARTGAQRNQAEGGILDYFARGAVRDVANQHVAEIAPAGAMRVYAEPETQGESYIPLANDSRRGRARAIFIETGKRLGFDHGALALLAGARANALGSISGGNVTVNLNSPEFQGFIANAKQAAQARVEAETGAAGVVGPIGIGGGNIVAIGRQLQGQGFRVSEHPAFGGVTRGAHVRNSKHYVGRAIDVNWYPAAAEPSHLDAIAPGLRRQGQVLWRVAGHYDHLHFAQKRGGILNFADGGLAGLPASMAGFDFEEYKRQQQEFQQNLEELAGSGLSPAELLKIRKELSRQAKRGQRALRDLVRRGYDPEGIQHLAEIDKRVRETERKMRGLGMAWDRIESSGYFSVRPRKRSDSRIGEIERAEKILAPPKVKSKSESDRILERYEKSVKRNQLDQQVFADVKALRGVSFDQGGFLPPGYTLAFNGTGKPERVLANEDRSVSVTVPVTVQGGATPETARRLEGAGKSIASDIVRALERGRA